MTFIYRSYDPTTVIAGFRISVERKHTDRNTCPNLRLHLGLRALSVSITPNKHMFTYYLQKLGSVQLLHADP
jgi:hypothetical protein